jgi:hypothetical protein
LRGIKAPLFSYIHINDNIQGDMMKVIIAGSRSINKISHIREAIDKSGYDITEVVSGCAAGADSLGEYFADLEKINLSKFPASWDQHGKAAGVIRNRKMADYADAAIVVWDGVSKGSKHMISEMHKRNKPCHVSLVIEDNFMDDVE